MKKATKGAVAAAAASTLLLGGAGTLAYWTGTSTATGEDITGGTLALSTMSCSWTVSHSGGTATSFDPATGRLVPGDTAVETCSSTITATGQNLVADLSATGGGATGDLASALTVTPAFTVDGASATSISSADDGKTLGATITVEFPMGTTADNSSNGGKAVSVADYVITATQVHP